MSVSEALAMGTVYDRPADNPDKVIARLCLEPGKRATCDRFQPRNSAQDITVPIRASDGDIDRDQICDDGAELVESYRAMTIANSVPSDDVAIARCRADDEPLSPRQERLDAQSEGG